MGVGSVPCAFAINMFIKNNATNANGSKKVLRPFTVVDFDLPAIAEKFKDSLFLFFIVVKNSYGNIIPPI
jgi:hypothetical protein